MKGKIYVKFKTETAWTSAGADVHELCPSSARHDFTTAQEATAPTPTPDPHTPAYYQAPESNSYEGWPAGPNVEAGSAVVMDLYSGAILYSKNADAQQYPASITKIMTTLLACENLDMNAQMTVSEFAAFSNEPGSSRISTQIWTKYFM